MAGIVIIYIRSFCIIARNDGLIALIILIITERENIITRLHRLFLIV